MESYACTLLFVDLAYTIVAVDALNMKSQTDDKCIMCIDFNQLDQII